jgi:hypothetical protein
MQLMIFSPSNELSTRLPASIGQAIAFGMRLQAESFVGA